MKTLQNFFSRTTLVVGLICLLCFFLPDVKAQEKTDTTKLYSGYSMIPGSLRGKVYVGGYYKEYDKWDWKTVRFPKSIDTMRIIIDKDTLFTDENYYRVLIKYELKKIQGKK